MILLQLATINFAIMLAFLNKWPIYKFRETGASKRMESEFHEANAAVKVFYAMNALFLYKGFLGGYFILFTSLMLIQWCVFDMAVNHFTDKPLFYIGNTAKLDKMQRKYLGKYAGQIKAGVCLLLIIGLNVLYYKFL